MASREARREFEEEHGVEAGNAEFIIKANKARFSRELRKASLLPLDVVATTALDLDKVNSKVDGELKSAAVRGPYVVAVVADDKGVTSKTVLAAEDILDQAEVDRVAEEHEVLATGPKEAPVQVTAESDDSQEAKADSTARKRTSSKSKE